MDPYGDSIMEVYMQNKPFILHPHDEPSTTRKMYNFPVAGGFNDDDIRKQMTEIFRKQGHSYKFNISAGTILENIVDGKYRYFVPGSNMYLLDTAIMVSDLQSLEEAITKLIAQNLDEVIRYFRPNSEYRLRFTTQLKYYVYSTEFPIGSNVKLPDFILKNRFISRGETQKASNNLCFFSALAHQMKRDQGQTHVQWLRRQTDYLFKKWIWFLFNKKLVESPTCHPTQFKGVDINQFPLLEDCFQINITVFELQPDRSAITRFISMKPYGKTLYLNLWQNHINLILDHKQFMRKYQCSSCQKCFFKPSALKRHAKGSCLNKTKFIFPGGYYSYFKTVFDELDEIGIGVKDEHRFYNFFLVWDMECVLLPTQSDREQTTNTSFTHTHKPICCSIASNVPGFTDAHSILEPQQDVLVKKMINFFLKIRTAAMKLIHKQWGYVIEELDQKILSRRSFLNSEKADLDLHSNRCVL